MTLGMIIELARELRVSIFKDTKKWFLECEIFDKLTNTEYITKSLDNIDRPSSLAIAQLIYFGNCIDYSKLSIFQKKGLVYNDMQIPDDIKNTIKESIYQKIMSRFEEQLYINQTPFLNLMLLLRLIQRNEIVIIINKKRFNHKFTTKDNTLYEHLEKYLQDLLKFLMSLGILYKQDKEVSVNHEKLQQFEICFLALYHC